MQTVIAPKAPFERYHTFAFGLAGGPPSGTELSADSLDVENRLRFLVAGALAQKGYAEGAGAANSDFVVRLAAGTGEALDVSLERCSVDDYDCEGQRLQKLSVTIDLYDTSTGSHVWHGTADVARERPRFDDALLGSIVKRAFADLPRRA